MSEPMNGAAKSAKPKKHRSPAYPAINLKTALARVRAFHGHERRNAASFAVAAGHWGFKIKSSGGLTTVAALKSFGLMRDIEAGAAGRTIQLTDLALRILLDERDPSPERESAIKQAALLPKIHRQLWAKWRTQLPSDGELRHQLIFEWKFNENSVADFIQQYRDTIAFAELSDSDTISVLPEDKSGDEDPLEMMNEPELISPAKQSPQPRVQSGPAPTVALAEKASERIMQARTRQDVFSLTEGTVTIQWPASLSPESFQDLADWLDILKRKIGRSVKTIGAEGGGADAN